DREDVGAEGRRPDVLEDGERGLVQADAERDRRHEQGCDRGQAVARLRGEGVPESQRPELVAAHGSRSPVRRAAPSEPSRRSAAAPTNHDEISRFTSWCAIDAPSCLYTCCTLVALPARYVRPPVSLAIAASVTGSGFTGSRRPPNCPPPPPNP